MRSSISSSDTTAFRRLPLIGGQALLGGLALFLAFAAVLECRLKLQGIHYAVADDEMLWIQERARASTLGERALILIGASRMQTDIDLDVLRTRTHLEPVQLAIDGSSFWPILEGLARDDRVRGTVLVSFQDSTLAAPDRGIDIASHYQQLYDERQSRAGTAYGYWAVENILAQQMRTHLLSYADGARPLSSLLTRAMVATPRPQYSFVLPDRSRLADYSGLDVPTVYYSRVERELGEGIHDAGTPFTIVDADLRSRVETLRPEPNSEYLRRTAMVADAKRTIEERGGKVYFLVLPTSGLISQIEEKRFPRDEFWNRFANAVGPHTLHSADVPALRNTPVPDGSHLDYRSRASFTNALCTVLGDMNAFVQQ